MTTRRTHAHLALYRFIGGGRYQAAFVLTTTKALYHFVEMAPKASQCVLCSLYIRRHANDSTSRSSKSKDKTAVQRAFNSPTADVLLRSADGVDFRVHKLFLSEASSVFGDMFASPHTGPPSPDNASSLPAGESDEVVDGLPVITLSESGSTLEALLGFLYPGKGGEIKALAIASAVVGATHKYSMPGVRKQLERVVLHPCILDKEPMRVYALACRYDMPEVAKAAAKATLSHPFPEPSIPEFDDLPATALCNLLNYRQKCAALIEPLLLDLHTVLAMDVPGVTRHRLNAYSLRINSECNKHCPSVLWFAEHRSRIWAEYRLRVCGTSVSSHSVLNQTLQTIKPNCDTCGTMVFQELVDYNERLAAILDLQIAKVCMAAFRAYEKIKVSLISTDALGSIHIEGLKTVAA